MHRQVESRREGKRISVHACSRVSECEHVCVQGCGPVEGGLGRAVTGLKVRRLLLPWGLLQAVPERDSASAWAGQGHRVEAADVSSIPLLF